jgi:hypothetical protein
VHTENISFRQSLKQAQNQDMGRPNMYNKKNEMNNERQGWRKAPPLTLPATLEREHRGLVYSGIILLPFFSKSARVKSASKNL